jgi:hypothetical protein
MSRTLTSDEAKSRPFEELLREVDASQMPLRVILDDGHEIDTTPAPKLKPLITHGGYAPEGWKDAIYEPNRRA